MVIFDNPLPSPTWTVPSFFSKILAFNIGCQCIISKEWKKRHLMCDLSKGKLLHVTKHVDKEQESDQLDTLNISFTKTLWLKNNIRQQIDVKNLVEEEAPLSYRFFNMTIWTTEENKIAPLYFLRHDLPTFLTRVFLSKDAPVLQELSRRIFIPDLGMEGQEVVHLHITLKYISLYIFKKMTNQIIWSSEKSESKTIATWIQKVFFALQEQP